MSGHSLDLAAGHPIRHAPLTGSQPRRGLSLEGFLAVPVKLEQGARTVTLARGRLAVKVRLRPLTIGVTRGGVPVIQELTLFAQEWSGGDRLIHLTEGVMVEEERDEPARLSEAELRDSDGAGVELAGELAGGEPFEVRVSISDQERLTVELNINRRLRSPRGRRASSLPPTWRGLAGSLSRAADRARGPALGRL